MHPISRKRDMAHPVFWEGQPWATRRTKSYVNLKLYLRSADRDEQSGCSRLDAHETASISG
jgi:hypothetical protein